MRRSVSSSPTSARSQLVKAASASLVRFASGLPVSDSQKLLVRRSHSPFGRSFNRFLGCTDTVGSGEAAIRIALRAGVPASRKNLSQRGAVH